MVTIQNSQFYVQKDRYTVGIEDFSSVKKHWTVDTDNNKFCKCYRKSSYGATFATTAVTLSDVLLCRALIPKLPVIPVHTKLIVP